MRNRNRERYTYQSFLIPGHVGLLVGVGVREALDGTSGTTEQSVQVRTDLVGAALLDGVALRATGLISESVTCKATAAREFPYLEEVGTLGGVT